MHTLMNGEPVTTNELEYTHPITVTEEQVVAWLNGLPRHLEVNDQGIAKNLTNWINSFFTPEDIHLHEIKQEILEVSI